MCTAPLDVVKGQPKIENPTIILRPAARARQARPAAMRLNESTTAAANSLIMPEKAQVKIAVVQGLKPGAEYEISRPLMTIGRLGGGADIEIDDPEVSRLHCSVEVRRDSILLQDLRSKNGTFLDGSRVFAAKIDETSRFKIGSTVLRVDRTPI
jgi:pSer/pThr/pTyr-binding forkhead associated (FHA) protein